MSEDLTWFWAIVDKEGFANVPSSERDALRILSRKASESDALREENARLREVLKEVSVCLDGDRTGEDLLFAVRAAAAAIREGGKDEN
jgi:hypothetical protein